MKFAVMQPYYFPYIGYFQLMSSVDKFVVFDDVNFIKKGWINRNRILVNNSAFQFVVPLNKASQNLLIRDISIAEDPWRDKLIKTVHMAYKKAPWFSEVIPVIEKIISFEEQALGSYVRNSLKELASFLELQTEIVDSSSVYGNIDLKGESRIIDICIQGNAHQYINPFGGQELYSREKFEENKLKLNFIKTGNISYRQYSDSFIPYLSIIDVLMFCGKDATKEHLKNFELI